MEGNLIRHWNKLQSNVARSSRDTELNAAVKGISEGIGMVELTVQGDVPKPSLVGDLRGRQCGQKGMLLRRIPEIYTSEHEAASGPGSHSIVWGVGEQGWPGCQSCRRPLGALRARIHLHVGAERHVFHLELAVMGLGARAMMKSGSTRRGARDGRPYNSLPPHSAVCPYSHMCASRIWIGCVASMQTRSLLASGKP